MDWGIPLDDGFEPAVSLTSLAPELRTTPAAAPTTATDMYALGRLAYHILSCGESFPADDQAALASLSRDNISVLFPRLTELEDQFPGAFDLLAGCVVDRQPVADCMQQHCKQQQYLLLLAQRIDSIDLFLLDGRLWWF
mgnify:CR=1 FL=1